SRRKRRFLVRRIVALAVVVAIAGGGYWLATAANDDAPGRDGPLQPAEDDRTFASDDPVERGCALPKAWLGRIWRGHDPKHSEDVTIVPLEPNYSGAFTVTSHSGPWDYLQTVPLVLYGPGHVESLGPLDERASITDVYPTVGGLLDVPLDKRQGAELTDAIIDGATPPRLVVIVVWDGVGRNVLERWPDAWPTLASMEEKGTSYRGALIGSSPSITPATHSSLGAGAFPRSHGVTAIMYRDATGDVRGAFKTKDPSDLRLTTFGDQVDQHFDNASKVGMLAWKNWHIGMLGHGLQTPGGDADQLAMIGGDGQINGNDLYYSTPDYLQGSPGLEEHLATVDREDGAADDKWMGHDLHELHDNPGWVRYESDLLMDMIKREGYGADEVPDILLTNFKMTDIAAHQYTMDSPEEEAVLRAQDDALGRLRDYLDRAVEDYTIVVTADHGHTPSAERSGAWPLGQGEMTRDVDRHFDVPEGKSLFDTTSAVGPFLNRALVKELGITGHEIAEFLNGYTIRDNWAAEELPDGYEDRGEENVLSAAFSRADYPAIMRCAFGAEKPPPGVGA
ncbi:MAG TPA: alkaline phosphatase family protein, partial [Actinomycetota bacterium]